MVLIEREKTCVTNTDVGYILYPAAGVLVDERRRKS
jgi:hypothetical protein